MSFTALFVSLVHTCNSKFHQFLNNRFVLFCFNKKTPGGIYVVYKAVSQNFTWFSLLWLILPLVSYGALLGPVQCWNEMTEKGMEPPHSKPKYWSSSPTFPTDDLIPIPFVSVAQNQGDCGDASPGSQWAPFVLGPASLRWQCELFAQWCARRRGGGGAFRRGQRGTWRSTRSRPVTGHHIREVGRHPRPARGREDVRKSSHRSASSLSAREKMGLECGNVKKKNLLLSSSLTFTDVNVTEEI